MKLVLPLFFCLGLLFETSAQIQKVYDDGQFAVPALYVGFNSITYFTTDSISSYSFVNFRLGAKTKMQISEKLVVNAWAVAHFEKNQAVNGYNSFEIEIKPTRKLRFHLGLIATPTTIIRPNPTTWQSQVETNAQQSIIAGRPGAKVSYPWSPNHALSYGWFNHGEEWVQHINVQIRRWQLAGYWSPSTSGFTVVKYQSANLESISSYSFGKQLNSSLFVRVKEGIRAYIDLGYLIEETEVSVFHTGIRKRFKASSAHMGGFFGVAYDWSSEVVLAQVFIHLF